MPVYEYQCTQCGEITEALQKISDPPLAECGVCSGTLNKLLSQSTFHLKGTGWYVTDYKDKKGSSENNGSGSKDKSGDAKSADKADKKSCGSDSGGSKCPAGSGCVKEAAAA